LNEAFGDAPLRATARAGANIAFIKYWGTLAGEGNLPLNSSLSMTLSDAVTVTTVAFDPDLRVDEIYLDGERLLDHRAERVTRHLDRVRGVLSPARAGGLGQQLPGGDGHGQLRQRLRRADGGRGGRVR